MKRPLLVFTIYLFVFMGLAAAVGPMSEDDDTTIAKIQQTKSMQTAGSD